MIEMTVIIIFVFICVFILWFFLKKILLTKQVHFHLNHLIYLSGADPGGGRAPPKIGKNMIFWRKIVIFHTKYPNNFRASLRNWKKYDFLS